MRTLFLICGSIFLILSPIGAQAMNLSPSTADIVLMPGEATTFEFVVENASSVNHTYAVSAYDVMFVNGTGEPQFGPLSVEHASWIGFDTYDFLLPAAASRTITLSIAVPDNAQTETLVFAPVVRESTVGEGLMLSTGMSSLLFLTIGNPKTEANISAFNVASKVFTHLPIEMSVKIANEGDRMVQPYGIVRITDVFGNVVDSFDMNETFRRVPPGISRTFAMQWGESVVGERSIIQELWRELTGGIGLFTAELVAASYPGAEPSLHATTRIVIFPWRIALLVGSVVTVTSFVIVRKRRRF